MIMRLITAHEPIIGSDLDRMLAQLDDVLPGLPVGEPTRATAQRAYMLGLLAADLTIYPPSNHLLELCRHSGVEEGESLTIARALASLLVRLAQRVGP